MIEVTIIRAESPALHRAALAWGIAGVIQGGAHEFATATPSWALWEARCIVCGEGSLHPRHLAAMRRRSARSATLQRPRKWTGPENAGE